LSKYRSRPPYSFFGTSRKIKENQEDNTNTPELYWLEFHCKHSI